MGCPSLFTRLCCFVCVLTSQISAVGMDIPDNQRYRILLVPDHAGIPSHVREIHTVGEILAERGHDVYTVLRDSFEDPSKLTEKGIKVLKYKTRPGACPGASCTEKLEKPLLAFQSKVGNFREIIARRELNFCEDMMNDEEFLKIAKELDFDLAIVYRFYLAQCRYILPHYLSISHVSIFSCSSVPWEGRIPMLPSFVPTFTGKLGEKMTFWERMENVYIHIWAQFFIAPSMYNNTLLKMHATGVNSWEELQLKDLLMFTTREHVLEWPQPSMPHLITMPPLISTDTKPLTKEYQQLLDSTTDGVIVVSFGSKAYTPDYVNNKFAEAFSKVKELVLWRDPGEIAEGALSSNIKVFPWLPQNDLLAHPKVKLFITHGGNNGRYEAVFHGVPMIVMPIFAEQPHNARAIADHQFGVVMDIRTFSAEELQNNIRHVIDTPHYKQKVQHASAVLRDSPMSSQETLIYWVEHVLKFGGGHLRSHALDMPWHQYLMLDILAFLLLIVIMVLYLLKRIACLCYSKLTEKANRKMKEQ